MRVPDTPPGGLRGKLKSGQWADLRTRFGWGALLLLLGVLLLVSSGMWLHFGVAIVVGLMMWELARLTGWRHPEFHSPRHPVLIAVLSALVLIAMVELPGDWPLILILVPILAGLPGTHSHERRAYIAFTATILGAGYALVVLREVMGLPTVLWIVATVVQSDVLGYFVGRKLGGPRFWPSISPKKTWSGTLAGWVGALVLSGILYAFGCAGPGILLIGPLLAIAGQFGDIAESWLKRRVSAKDSSDLIPGHGGVMDRFDAMAGALLLALVLMLFHILPEIGG
ncbi:phosphatidate cytidylyltransferase [Paracoccus sp. PAR01]|uniref:phosphatidate cytidylyltransferase n=1 Tax=Paracoccus sp. PAR01 TaxID=2769282 RepID=UPI001783FEEC|nr:phosphatidate cytidylyltransferase [Paracoccus sp. PAR01]